MKLCPLETYWKGFSKIFRLGVICPQENFKQVRYSLRAYTRTAHGTHCITTLFTSCCITRVSKFPVIFSILYNVYGFGAPRSQNSPIFTFLPIRTKCLKCSFILYSPGVTCCSLFHVVVEGPKMCLLQCGFLVTLDGGAADPKVVRVNQGSLIFQLFFECVGFSDVVLHLVRSDYFAK